VENGVMISTGAKSYLVLLWQPPVLSGGPVSRDISGVSRRMGEGNENLVYLSPWDFKRSLTYRLLRLHLITEGRFAVDFIALKNPSLLLGSNPRPLDAIIILSVHLCVSY
jgi:hypothetical protein